MGDPISRRDFVVSAALASSALTLCSTRGAAKNLGTKVSNVALSPVSHLKVTLVGSFWGDKQKTVARRTVQTIIDRTEQTGHLLNFERAARRARELPEGGRANDSDVYKALEMIAYSLNNYPDETIERTADDWIDKIAAAQLPDGYLNTYFTLIGLDKRWTDTSAHEDYCAGHLIEAAVAYYQTTGKRKLLDVAVRFADHIDSTFRGSNRSWVSGHEEIELALVKLYRITGNSRYLRLAEWYLDQRGHGYYSPSWKPEDHEYDQNSIPVRAQRKITGHAVRAAYLYTAVADVAAITGDAGYRSATEIVWEDVVRRHMYVTGGIGSSDANEGFDKDFALPNMTSYCETCAAVGMVLWSHRLNMLTGESQYVDVLERTLYNAALAGISLSGDLFFYQNPLATNKSSPKVRQEWFQPACCPSNIARLISSIGGYIYGVSDSAIWVNLYTTSRVRLQIRDANITLRMDTAYPWSGEIKLTIDSDRRQHYALRLRVPGWARNVAVPGGPYLFLDQSDKEVRLLVNGQRLHHREAGGYLVVEREWSKGDVIELSLPMPTRSVVAGEQVQADRNKVTLQRGPLVYCIESSDNEGDVWNALVDRHTQFYEEPARILDETVVAIRGTASILKPSQDGFGVERRSATLTAVPYYSWANRGGDNMQVWLPTVVESVAVNM